MLRCLQRHFHVDTLGLHRTHKLYAVAFRAEETIESLGLGLGPDPSGQDPQSSKDRSLAY